MRRPKNIKQYTSPEDALRWMRWMADQIEHNPQSREPGMLLQIRIDVRYWHEDWAKKAKLVSV